MKNKYQKQINPFKISFQSLSREKQKNKFIQLKFINKINTLAFRQCNSIHKQEISNRTNINQYYQFSKLTKQDNRQTSPHHKKFQRKNLHTHNLIKNSQNHSKSKRQESKEVDKENNSRFANQISLIKKSPAKYQTISKYSILKQSPDRPLIQSRHKTARKDKILQKQQYIYQDEIDEYEQDQTNFVNSSITKIPTLDMSPNLID